MGLSKKEIEALKRISVDMSSVLANESQFQSLNTEISENCDQDEARKYASKDETLKELGIVIAPQVEAVEDEKPTLNARGRSTRLNKPVKRVEKVVETPLKVEEPVVVSTVVPVLKSVQVEPTVQVLKPKKEEKIMNDLDNDLDMISKKMKSSNEPAAEPDFKDQVSTLLAKLPGAPSPQRVEGLKKEFGAVYATAFSEKDVFLFTFLKRSQWTKIQEILREMGERAPEMDTQKQLKEKVVTNCVLYPNVKSETFLFSAPAGLVDTLFDLIMLHSYFLNTQQAMQLTVTL